MCISNSPKYYYLENLFEKCVGFYENVEKCGCKMLSTTLSGYTEYCEPTEEPDFDFLKLLSEKSILPIIAEGRYSTKEHVYFAKQNGASNIVIGTAITRPHLITKRFKENFDEI